MVVIKYQHEKDFKYWKELASLPFVPIWSLGVGTHDLQKLLTFPEWTQFEKKTEIALGIAYLNFSETLADDFWATANIYISYLMSDNY